MRGGGLGMTYDQTNDVLGLAERAHVNITDEEGNTTLDFQAGSALVNRLEDVMTLDGEVHVLRGDQQFVADRAVARMTSDESAVTFIELRGSASVSGGGSGLDAMSARDIELDYTDDGATLERVLLTGDAAVALTGQEGASGRQMTGGTLDLTLAPDGAVTRAIGRDTVRLALPGSGEATARAVTARALDAAGEPGRGLTGVRFTDDVEYREEAARGRSARTARSRALRIALDGDAIDAAVFTGGARFEEQGLVATAGEAYYEPRQGTLRLSGVEGGTPPRVADQRITIDAPSIAVTLEGRSMRATGGVRTAVRAQRESRLPGLLSDDAPANVEARTLEYNGGSGRAVYTGDAALWQNQTAIRGDAITLDQESGDLAVVGAARSDIALDVGRSVGRATEIRYDEATRVISYLSHRPPPVPPGTVQPGGAAPAATPAPARGGRAVTPPAPPPVRPQAQVSGPQGDLRADRIEVALAGAGNRAERIEAYVGVNARIDTRVATSDRLTYFAADERYVLSSTGATPVTVVDACRETSGRTLTFFKTADRIIVDGNEQIRTQTKTGGPCTAPTATPAR
jgi:lipopolysaccharide export system protein LptA